ncbi:hypothetical protein B0J14DRAFT_700405 [Halenospora varia]|nr:hypothetical protein B0J14DRAFT_700405 [Halenospora varia]
MKLTSNTEMLIAVLFQVQLGFADLLSNSYDNSIALQGRDLVGSWLGIRYCTSGYFGCGNGCCPSSSECCASRSCIPTGTECCLDGTYCTKGNMCVIYQGQMKCCTNLKCTAHVPPSAANGIKSTSSSSSEQRSTSAVTGGYLKPGESTSTPTTSSIKSTSPATTTGYLEPGKTTSTPTPVTPVVASGEVTPVLVPTSTTPKSTPAEISTITITSSAKQDSTTALVENSPIVPTTSVVTVATSESTSSQLQTTDPSQVSTGPISQTTSVVTVPGSTANPSVRTTAAVATSTVALSGGSQTKPASLNTCATFMAVIWSLVIW